MKGEVAVQQLVDNTRQIGLALRVSVVNEHLRISNSML